MTTQTTKNTKRKPTGHGSDKKSRGWMPWVLSAGFILIAAFIAAYFMLLSGSAPSSALIRVPSNASSAQVQDSLVKYLGPGYSRKVMRLAHLRGADFSTRHGAYLIEAGDNPLAAMRRLTGGAQHPQTITINGFRLLPLLERRVAARFDFSDSDFHKALCDPQVLETYGLTRSRRCHSSSTIPMSSTGAPRLRR